MTSVRRLFVFIFLISTTLPAQQKELRILSASPQGATKSIDQSFRIVVTFSEPMTALTVGSESQRPYPLEISPSVKGTYRWLGTTTLAFIPSDTLPFATAYTATIPAGTRSLSGAELQQAYAWTFETPRPSILQIVPDAVRGRIEPGRPITILFNQPIDLAMMGDWISVYDIDSATSRLSPHTITLRRPTDTELFADRSIWYYRETHGKLSEDQQRWVDWMRPRSLTIEPSSPYQKGGRIYLECKGGLKSTDGKLGMAEWKVMNYSIYGDLKFKKVEDADRVYPQGRTTLIFTNPVSRQELLNHLTITPDVAIDRSEKYDNWDERHGFTFKLQPETEYRGTITAGMKDIFGNEIQSDVPFTFRTSGLSPSVTMESGPRVIEAYEKHTIDATFLNCDSVLLTMGTLRPEQIVPFVSNSRIYDDYQWNEDLLGRAAKEGWIKRVWTMSDPHNQKVTRQIDLDEVLGPNHRGIGFVQLNQVEAKNLMPRASKSVVRVTDIGLTLKVSSDSILVFATRLKDASPVKNAEIEIRTDVNKVVWSGRTDVDGIARVPGWSALDIQLTPRSSGSNGDNWMATSPRLWVIAQKDGDCSYASSQEENNRRLDIDLYIRPDSSPQPEKFTGVLFTDRGLYKAGETVNLKAVVRLRQGDTWHVVPDALARITVKDPRGGELLSEDVRLDEFGSFSLAVPIRLSAPTGEYAVSVAVRSTKAMRFSNVWMQAAEGSFRVEAFRPAEFEVHAGFERGSYTLGDTVQARMSARYLFGAPMKKAPMEWNWIMKPVPFTPHGYEAYSFGAVDGLMRNTAPTGSMYKNGRGMLDDGGSFTLPVRLLTGEYHGTYAFEFRGGATSPTHQNLWNSASVIIHAGDYYVGVKPSTFFVSADSSLTCSLVAVTKDALPVAERSVVLKIYRRTWHSDYISSISGWAFWETSRIDSLADSLVVKTSTEPVKHRFTPGREGFYFIDATSVDDRGDTITTQTSFYASGRGYIPWGRYANNNVELVADRKEYIPGDQAEILVKNPYERATALVSIERDGILSHFTTVLTGGAPRITIPIEHAYLPNVFVSVMLLHGSTEHPADSTEPENWRPSFKIGYVNLPVSPKERHLHVGVETSRTEYHPGDTVTAVVTVRNAAGEGVKSDLVISAADRGVLDLIDYHLPDPFDTFYHERRLGVTSNDLRLYLRTERNSSVSAQTAMVRLPEETGYRKDFAPTAYWNPSLATDDSGRAVVRFKLPDNITAFKLMCVAQTLSSEFGEGVTSFTVTKPLLLQPSLPRLARVGDEFDAGAVIINNTKEAASITVTAKASGIALQGETQTHINLAPGESHEVTFHFMAEKIGKAVVAFEADGVKDRDALQWSFPVVSPRVKESVALSNSSTEPMREEQLFIPEAIDTTDGNVEFTAASTALVGLSGAMNYLFTYPYGCIEQRVSSALPVILAEDLVKAFGFSTFRNRDYKEVAQRTIDDLVRYQTYDGGFSYWAGGERRMPYVSAYAVYALLEAKEHGYDVNTRTLENGLKYLAGKVVEKDAELGDTPDAARITRAFMLYALAHAGRMEHRAILDTLFSKRDSLPLFAQAYLLRAAALLKPGSPIADELARGLMNYLKVDPTGASFEEQNGDALVSVFHSNTRTTALILQALIETNREPAVAERIVRRLLSLQRNGRWRTTQENLYVVAALAAYYKKFEAEEPDFRAEIAMNGKMLLTELFDGRSLDVKKEHVPLSQLLKGKTMPVTISKEGDGRLYYGLRMNYFPVGACGQKNEGLAVSRSIESVEGKGERDIRTGELWKVTVTVAAAQDRHYVAVDDPVPAGFEVVATTFATSDPSLKERYGANSAFNHVERYDDHVTLFADEMPAGVHTYTYYVRAIHAGTYVVPPTHAECMYEPEVFGSTASGMVTIYK